MPHALIYNTKPLQAPLQYSILPELLENVSQPSYKHFQSTRVPSPFPDPSLLEVLKQCESNPENLRFSVATRTRLSLRSSKPSIGFWELPGDRSTRSYLEIKDELAALVDALRRETFGNGQSRSVCVRKPELGCKILVRMQTKENARFSTLCAKDVLVACITISPLEGHREEGQEQVVFCCGKSTRVRLGCFGVRWAVDLRPDGKAERRGLVKKMLALKRRLRKDVEVDDEKEHLLM